MKIFGLSKKQIELIKSILEQHLTDIDDAKAYIFGSRANGKFKEYSDIDIAIKSKNDKLPLLLSKMQDLLEESDLPFKVDLLNWEDIAKEYLPSIKKHKKEFWSPKEIEKKSDWRICPIGQHWTRTHPYKVKTGVHAVQTGHCKKNPSGKDILKKDEIEMIPSLDIFKHSYNSSISNNLGFESGNIYDDLISGWVAYWNSVFNLSVPLAPHYFKILIATESGFRPKIITKTKSIKTGKAAGLGQLTNEVIRLLKNKNGEIKDHYVELGKDDALDPNMNIAASVRWLFRKYETARNRLKREPSWEEVLWEFKGVTKDESKRAKEIKEKIKKYLKDFNLQSQYHS